jgi:hypothetical protein
VIYIWIVLDDELFRGINEYSMIYEFVLMLLRVDITNYILYRISTSRQKYSLAFPYRTPSLYVFTYCILKNALK